jgi:hypothetical protein
MFDSIFVNGTVGSAKSAVADALGAHEQGAGHPHAVIDLDHIRRAWPLADRVFAVGTAGAMSTASDSRRATG